MADEEAIERLVQEAGPIIGFQRARLGAERFAAVIQGHSKLQGMMMFLLMSAFTVAQAGYSDEALEAFRKDARDVRQAGAEWARTCENIADMWQAQRRESERVDESKSK